MWDPLAGGVHETRDIIWLSRMFYQKQSESLEVNITPLLEYIIPHNEEQEVMAGNNEDADVTEIEKVKAGEGKPKLTRSGRAVNIPERYRDVTALTVSYEMMLSDAEKVYYDYMTNCPDENHKVALELSCVGAGIGGGFEHTQELHAMKFEEAMQTEDKKKWEVAVEEEYNRMLKHGVFKPVAINNLPLGTKPITSTWAMKKSQMVHIVHA